MHHNVSCPRSTKKLQQRSNFSTWPYPYRTQHSLPPCRTAAVQDRCIALCTLYSRRIDIDVVAGTTMNSKQNITTSTPHQHRTAQHLVLLHTFVLCEEPPSLSHANGSAVKMSDRFRPLASTTVTDTE